MAHPIAEFLAAFKPPRTASAPPVKKPAMMALYGSSFFRIPLTAQSNVENRPPHTPKLPPRTGARALMAVTAPIRRSPYGEFRKPLTPCQTAPPIPYIGSPQISHVGFNPRDQQRPNPEDYEQPGAPGREGQNMLTPIQNAPPKSLSVTQGQGSRE